MDEQKSVRKQLASLRSVRRPVRSFDISVDGIVAWMNEAPEDIAETFEGMIS